MENKTNINKRIEIIKYLFYHFTKLDSNELNLDITVESVKGVPQNLVFEFYLEIYTDPFLQGILKELSTFHKKIDSFFDEYDFDENLNIIRGKQLGYPQGAMTSKISFESNEEKLTAAFQWMYSFGD